MKLLVLLLALGAATATNHVVGITTNCVREVEARPYTLGPGLSNAALEETFCVTGEILDTHDIDTFGTELGFAFGPSEWGTPLTFHGTALAHVLVYQSTPYAPWRKLLASKSGYGIILFTNKEIVFEHYPPTLNPPPYLFVTVLGRPQTYEIDNFAGSGLARM